jgi:tol-pal system protein YbgF
MRYHPGLLAVAVLAWTAGAQAASGSVEMRLRALESRLPDADRMATLEKSLGNQGAGVLAGDVDQLKTELRELRGQIEQLTHQIQKQQQSQQRLYGDLDKRLQALEARAATSATMSGVEGSTGSVLPSSGAISSPPTAGQEQAEYLAAFELLQQGKTTEAIPAFEGFLRRYPTGSYASNARYWMGEGYYLNKNYPQAMAEFQKLIEQHPESNKLSGALLKMGYIHYENRNYPEARAVLEKVKGAYPNTNVSTLAAERLERMRKEGV